MGYSELFVTGSLVAGGGHIETGSTDALITGGSFLTLVGGNATVADYAGFDGLYFLETSSGSSKMGQVSMQVSGEGTSSKLLVGGNYISGDVSGALAADDSVIRHIAELGDTDIQVSGGTHSTITSGSYVGGGITNAQVESETGYLVTQGDLVLRLTGDTVLDGKGVVAAAGIIETSKVATGDYASVGQYYGGYDSSGENIWPYPEGSFHYASEHFYDAVFGGEEIDPSGLFIAPVPMTVTTPGVTGGDATLEMTTESTTVELGKDVTFASETVISGGYIASMERSGSTGEQLMEDGTFADLLDSYRSYTEYDIAAGSYDSFFESTSFTEQDIYDWLDSWAEAYETSLAEASGGHSELSGRQQVIGNRKIVLNEGDYQNLANARFVDFDEVSVGAGSTVDFRQNEQDLDAFNARNQLAADSTRVSLLADGTAQMTGENTIRKTGEGTLYLSDTNGQINKAETGGESNLQLVVEAGKVVLASHSSSTDKADFSVMAIHQGATLDMSAGDNTTAGAAGINGHLKLEQNAKLIADAGRYVEGTGTSMTAGALSVNTEFILALAHTDSIQKTELRVMSLTGVAPSGMTVPADMQLGAFEIVLFSDLASVHGIDFYSASWGMESIEIAFAGDYLSALSSELTGEQYFVSNDNSSWDSNELYFVKRANGDLVLTSGSELTIPEPSTATLSLLALAGLLARRRRA